MKATNAQKEFEFEDIEVNSHQKSNRNLKRLQYNALTDSIAANQVKHKANEQILINMLQDAKINFSEYSSLNLTVKNTSQSMIGQATEMNFHPESVPRPHQHENKGK